MPEGQTPIERPEEIQDPEEAKLEAKRKRAFYWQMYGWAVIGLIILIIILNLFGFLSPDFNQYGMVAMVIAYGVYIVFRRR